MFLTFYVLSVDCKQTFVLKNVIYKICAFLHRSELRFCVEMWYFNTIFKEHFHIWLNLANFEHLHLAKNCYFESNFSNEL